MPSGIMIHCDACKERVTQSCAKKSHLPLQHGHAQRQLERKPLLPMRDSLPTFLEHRATRICLWRVKLEAIAMLYGLRTTRLAECMMALTGSILSRASADLHEALLAKVLMQSEEG